ncbi:MAG: FHA domain-containing protein [Myxococcaceae bacterium]
MKLAEWVTAYRKGKAVFPTVPVLIAVPPREGEFEESASTEPGPAGPMDVRIIANEVVVLLARELVDGRVYTVGRIDLCDTHLPFPTISKVHASFRHGSQGWEVQDVGSLNGTRVATERIEKGVWTPVRDGSEIMFGRVLCRLLSPQSFAAEVLRQARLAG